MKYGYLQAEGLDGQPDFISIEIVRKVIFETNYGMGGTILLMLYITICCLVIAISKKEI